MALHIADPEVSRLVSDLARIEGTTNTEALRRVLRSALAERKTTENRKGFREFSMGIVADAQKKKVKPATKQEWDALWF